MAEQDSTNGYNAPSATALPAPRIDRITFWLLILPLIAAVGGIYYYYITIEPVLLPSDFHEMLGESFLAGHTYLLHFYPTRDLLSLPDPYNSYISRFHGALWDASLFHGHYYLYFGPVPALLICAPLKYLAGIHVSDPIMTWGFSFAGTAFVLLLLACVAARQNFTSRLGMVFCIIAISLGTWLPFMLRRPSFYEVAVSGAYCFSALGALLLWHSLTSAKPLRLAFAASLCFGLAVGCRHLHVFNIAVLLTAWAMTWRAQPLRRFLCFFLPWGLCVLCVMLYNYERFGSFFESGLHYQITIFNVHAPDYQPLKLARFFQNLYYYFFRPLDWLSTFTFPFFNVTYYNETRILGGMRAETLEPLYGLFSNSPFSLFLFTALFTFWDKRTRYSGQTLIILTGIVLYITPIMGYLMFFIFTTMRYQVDFSPWLMFIASLQYLRLLAMAKGRKWRGILYTVGGAAALYGAFTGTMSGYCGQYLCKGANPWG